MNSFVALSSWSFCPSCGRCRQYIEGKNACEGAYNEPQRIRAPCGSALVRIPMYCMALHQFFLFIRCRALISNLYVLILLILNPPWVLEIAVGPFGVYSDVCSALFFFNPFVEEFLASLCFDYVAQYLEVFGDVCRMSFDSASEFNDAALLFAGLVEHGEWF